MEAFKHSAAPALTVRKENVYDALNRVVPPDSGPLWGGEVCRPFVIPVQYPAPGHIKFHAPLPAAGLLTKLRIWAVKPYGSLQQSRRGNR